MDNMNLFEPEASRFIRNITPINVFALMGDIKDKFHYPEAYEYLAAKGYDIKDFYFNRGSYMSWFCYYHKYVVIDITHFTEPCLKDFRILEFIELESERLQTALAEKNFKNFFYMIDDRIALFAYQELFDIIPDNDKYDLLWLIYFRCGYHLEQLNREAVSEVLRYRPREKHREDAGTDGYVKIYRGQIAGSIPVSLATSWTTDLNTAIYYATRFNQSGTIFSARIHQDKVIAYIKRHNDKEILAYPEDIQNISKEHFMSFDDLLPELEDTGVLAAYEYYSSRLKPEYFHNPTGIHGLSHTRRVLLLVLILAHLENLSPRCSQLLSIIALYHDIGRTNDNFDPHHGRASCRKINRLDLLDEIENTTDREIINFIITNHCVEDTKALNKIDKYNIRDKAEATTLFKIFKDADGLDRIRINDLDIRLLRTKSAQKLPLLARQILNSYL